MRKSTFYLVGAIPSGSCLFGTLSLGQAVHVVLQSTTFHFGADRVLTDVHHGKGHGVLVHQIELNISFVTATVWIPQANPVCGIEEDAVERDHQLGSIKFGSQCKRIEIAQNKTDVISAVSFVGSSEGHIPLKGKG